MAIAEFSNSGVMIGYDPTVKQSIENQLKTFFPDGLSGNANLADYATLFSSLLLNSNSKVVKVYANGKSLIIDGTTNKISSSGSSDVYDWIRSFSSAGVAVGIGLAVDLVPLPGTTVAGFFLGNAGSTWYLDNLFDPLVGVRLYKYKNIDTNDSSLTYKTDSNLKNTLHDFWTNEKPDFNLSLLRTQLSKFSLITSDTPKITFIKQGNGTTIQFESKPVEDNFREILKLLPFGDLPIIKYATNSYQLLANYYAQEVSPEILKSDEMALYAALAMKPYVLQGDPYDTMSVDVTELSDMFLKDRAKMFNAYTHEPTNLPAYNTTYIDLGQNNPNSNFITYDPNNNIKGYRDGNVGTVVFGTDSNDTYGAATGMGVPNGELHLYGRGGNDTLYGNIGNDWIEGGDGGDTLEGGAGKDVLIGGFTKDKVDAFTDYLYGGSGKDIYISGDSDHIKDDTTGEGRVYFEGKLLTGGTKEAGAGCGTGPNGSDEYYGDGGVYRLSGTTLTFTKDKKILTINDYIKNDLSITLKDNKADNGACPSSAPNAPCPKPTNPLFRFNFSLPSVTRTVINYLSGGGGGTPPIVLDLNRNGITSINRTQFISKHKELAA